MLHNKTILTYRTSAGNEPFTDWLNNLRDSSTRRRILRRMRRLEHGHYGDAKSVGGGVRELRFFFGAGYRVYFAEDGDTIIVLLCGGDKSNQRRDILKAQAYWQEYQTYE